MWARPSSFSGHVLFYATDLVYPYRVGNLIVFVQRLGGNVFDLILIE